MGNNKLTMAALMMVAMMNPVLIDAQFGILSGKGLGQSCATTAECQTGLECGGIMTCGHPTGFGTPVNAGAQWSRPTDQGFGHTGGYLGAQPGQFGVAQGWLPGQAIASQYGASNPGGWYGGGGNVAAYPGYGFYG